MLSRPPDDHPHDVWAFGADLDPGTILGACRRRYDNRPMSFVNPITKSSKTSPMPTIDTRS